MQKTIKHFLAIASSIFVLCFLAIQVLPSPDTAMGDTVTVSAVVSGTYSCSYSTTTASFGTITTSAVATAYSSTTIDVTSNTITYVKVYDAGDTSNPGLYYAGGPDLIGSADSAYGDTATLVAGTEGYGIQGAVTAGGSGGDFTIAATYLQTSDNVGGLELAGSEQTLASSDAAVTRKEVVVTYKAAVSSSNLSGTYTDTVTYTCTTSL